MILVLLILAFVALTLLARQFGADSRDGRDWSRTCPGSRRSFRL